MPKWADMAVRPDTTLLEAIRIIDAGGGQIALVLDDDKKLLGVITDADIRKAIVRGIALENSCSSVMTTSPVTLNVSTTRDERLALMRQRHIRQLPIVDAENRLADVALLMDLVSPETQSNPVVIMAGGLGSRLGSLTQNAPKPLLPVGSKPILETIVDQLSLQGFRRFYFAINFKAEMIEDHFGDGSAWNVEINYLRERKRLGTGGALHLLPEGIEDDILVMNGDILTKVDFMQMLATHKLAKAALTMGVKHYSLPIPYGVVEIDDNNQQITSLREKPEYSFFVNGGMYVVAPRALRHIPADQYFDMPSLFEALKSNDEIATAFPIREYWLDIGQPNDYERANAEFDHHFRAE